MNTTLDRPAPEVPVAGLPVVERPARTSRTSRIGSALVTFGRVWSASVAAAAEVELAATPAQKRAAAERFAAKLNG